MNTLLKIIILYINKILETYQLFYYKKNKYSSFGNTAVKTKFGFWYIGNIFDKKDIASGILHNGLIENDETDLTLKIFSYLKRLQKIHIVDIGANTGYYTLLSSFFLKEHSAHIFSFEPVKNYFECMQESIRINGFDTKKITLRNLALSNKCAEDIISISGTSSSLEKDFVKDNNERQKVTLKTLDSFSEEIQPDFIKIDVEGHELMVIEGSLNILKENNPIIFIELIQKLDSHNFTNQNYSKTLDLLNNLGYTGYLFENNKLEKLVNKFHKEGVAMYLFINKKKHIDLIKYLSDEIS